jgi:hypothetical protein
MFDVTGLQMINNLYPGDIQFKNTENSANNRQIGALTTERVGNTWIPWCDGQDQFLAHHLEIESGNLKLFVWQHGPSIYYSRTGWSESAAQIAGNPGVNQSVAWILDPNGQLIQTHCNA